MLQGSSRVLIIGYGNSCLGDDGAGPAVIERLESAGLSAAAELTVLHQLLPEYAAQFAEARRVVLVDADAGLPPGELRVRRVSSDANFLLGHRWGPQAVAALARGLYGRVARVTAYTIGGASFEPGETLSPAVATTVGRLARHLAKRLAIWNRAGASSRTDGAGVEPGRA